MKVLLLNGSTHEHGCTYTALSAVAGALEECGVETEIAWIGAGPTQDCIACGQCSKLDKCCFDNDIVNKLIEKAKTCDGFVFGSPVYYAHASGRILSVLDRVFYAGSEYFANKPGAAVSSARRAGTTCAIDDLNKYFTISNMPVVSSTYWNMVHGAKAEDVLQDEEGLQTMRNLGRNMAWLIKSIAAGKENGVSAPALEYGKRTNFVR